MLRGAGGGVQNSGLWQDDKFIGQPTRAEAGASAAAVGGAAGAAAGAGAGSGTGTSGGEQRRLALVSRPTSELADLMLAAGLHPSACPHLGGHAEALARRWMADQLMGEGV